MRAGALAALLLSGCTYMLDPRFFDLGATDAGDLSGSADTDGAAACDPPLADIWAGTAPNPSTVELQPCVAVFHLQNSSPATLMRKLTTMPGKALTASGAFSHEAKCNGWFSVGFSDDMGAFSTVSGAAGSIVALGTARRGQTSFVLTVQVSQPCDVYLTKPVGEVAQ
ncbi:MAG TPA: hypothetical protein PKV97_00210 [Thauera aminoaromatica]|nr:hypothetical protein [Thauera aminoaromatica]